MCVCVCVCVCVPPGTFTFIDGWTVSNICVQRDWSPNYYGRLKNSINIIPGNVAHWNRDSMFDCFQEAALSLNACSEIIVLRIFMLTSSVCIFSQPGSYTQKQNSNLLLHIWQISMNGKWGVVTWTSPVPSCTIWLLQAVSLCNTNGSFQLCVVYHTKEVEKGFFNLLDHTLQICTYMYHRILLSLPLNVQEETYKFISKS